MINAATIISQIKQNLNKYTECKKPHLPHRLTESNGQPGNWRRWWWSQEKHSSVCQKCSAYTKSKHKTQLM